MANPAFYLGLVIVVARRLSPSSDQLVKLAPVGYTCYAIHKLAETLTDTLNANQR